MLSPKAFILEWKLKGRLGRFYMALGALFLVLALIGAALPIVPQVPFAIASAYFFSKGSIPIHMWMRNNHYFGKPIREWEDHKVIRPHMKIIATFSMLVGAIFGHYRLSHEWAIALDVWFAVSIIFILTRKSYVIPFVQKFRKSFR